jgi:tRNA A37 threonylcarbamoyladenosine biosynthesis protein TsaE
MNILGNKNGVSCIEWAERTPSLIKGKIFNVKIDKIDDNTRKIMIDEVKNNVACYKYYNEKIKFSTT